MLGRVVIVVSALTAGASVADPYDFDLYKLGQPAPTSGCTDTIARCSAEANANFRAFVRELGAALTSVNLMPPETLGHAAFSASGELSIVDLQASGSGPLPTRATFRGPLLVPSVHVRKGLPFSFEVGARLAWIEKSRMAAATGEAKWALNEGFALLPDVGVRGYVTRLLNTRDFDLTAGGLDVGLGKQFPIGGMITLTPYVGWNLVWVAGNSGTIDFRPERTYEGSIATPTAQLADTNVFAEVPFAANSHNRFYGGLRFVGGVLQLGVEVSYSSLGKFRDSTGADRSLPDLKTLNWMVGLDF